VSPLAGAGCARVQPLLQRQRVALHRETYRAVGGQGAHIVHLELLALQWPRSARAHAGQNTQVRCAGSAGGTGRPARARAGAVVAEEFDRGGGRASTVFGNVLPSPGRIVCTSTPIANFKFQEVKTQNAEGVLRYHLA
jgi:hypothetical protein